MERQLVQIIPPEPDKSGIVLTQGTKVMVGNQELTHVTKIVLKAEVNSIWEAEIYCQVQMQQIDALAVIHYQKPWLERWLERLISWFNQLP